MFLKLQIDLSEVRYSVWNRHPIIDHGLLWGQYQYYFLYCCWMREDAGNCDAWVSNIQRNSFPLESFVTLSILKIFHIHATWRVLIGNGVCNFPKNVMCIHFQMAEWSFKNLIRVRRQKEMKCLFVHKDLSTLEALQIVGTVKSTKA